MSQTSSAQALTDLQAAQKANRDQITALQQLVTDGITKLEALIAANPQGVAPADIEAVVSSMKDDSAAVGAISTQITTEEQKEGV